MHVDITGYDDIITADTMRWDTF